MRPVALKSAIRMHFDGYESRDMEFLELAGIFVLLYIVYGDPFWWGNAVWCKFNAVS